MNAKICRTCGVMKPQEEFSKDSKTTDGRANHCRACAAEYRRLHAGSTPRSRRAPAPTFTAPTSSGARTTAETDYIPPRDVVATFAASQIKVARGGLAPNFLYIGPSGSGKTEAARHLSRLAGLDFTHVDAPAMTDPEAWFGTREVVVQDGAPMTVYHPSDFATAIERPGGVLIDEANRAPDQIRAILLALLDDTRQATNPITGGVVKRHRECYVWLTGNVGLNFTGTFAVDPAFFTRTLTSRFDYLDQNAEAQLAVSRTGVDPDAALLFARFARETRDRAALDEEFPPISTREVLAASDLVACGLDVNTAVHQAIINAAPTDGGAESVSANLEMIWTGIRPK